MPLSNTDRFQGLAECFVCSGTGMDPKRPADSTGYRPTCQLCEGCGIVDSKGDKVRRWKRNEKREAR